MDNNFNMPSFNVPKIEIPKIKPLASKEDIENMEIRLNAKIDEVKELLNKVLEK